MEERGRPRGRIATIGWLAAPVLAVVSALALPPDYVDAGGERVPLGPAARATAAVAVWMAVWWLTEAIPIYATALLPLALFPVSGATTMKAAATPYAHPLIFLFLGGFLIALGMQRWGLDRRVALSMLRLVGARPAFVVGGFMAVTAAPRARVGVRRSSAASPSACCSVSPMERRSGVSERWSARRRISSWPPSPRVSWVARSPSPAGWAWAFPSSRSSCR
jgi:hypothetical protein